MKKLWDSYRSSFILLFGIIVGSILGLVLKEKAVILKPIGQIFINSILVLIVPIVFTTISVSTASIKSMDRLKSILKNMFLVFFSTGVIASIIILVIVKVFPPVKEIGEDILKVKGQEIVQTVTDGKVDNEDKLKSEVSEMVKNETENKKIEKIEEKSIVVGDKIVETLTVSDFKNLISIKSILPLIIFSAVFGLCTGSMKEKGEKIVELLDTVSEVLMKMMNLLMKFAPIGLGAYFAAIIGEYGSQILGSYARAMVIYYPLCIAYFFIMFPVYGYVAGGKEGVRRLKHLLAPAITSLSTQSSIATLPVNLEAARKIGVPKDIREIVLPIGATAHMDGTVFSSVLKISFLFGIYHQRIDSIEMYITILLLSIVGGMVMSGVPGGGMIGEALIVSFFNFPPEALGLINIIGYLVDPPATLINATGDTVASMLVARLVEGKEWIKNKIVD